MNDKGTLIKPLSKLNYSDSTLIFESEDTTNAQMTTYDNESFVNVPQSLVEELDLQDIKYFSPYLDKLRTLNENYIIFMVIRDEGTKGLYAESEELLRSLGYNTDFSSIPGYSYISVLEKGKLVYSDNSLNKIIYHTDFDGKEIFLESANYGSGNYCSINIDGTEFAQNQRGMNFVVYDKENHKVVDSVAFDTYDKCTCYRL